MSGPPREEVELAFWSLFNAPADEGWDKWPDHFTEDCFFWDHAYHQYNGREALRAWIVPTMAPEPMNLLWSECEWFTIEGERCIWYTWNHFPGVNGVEFKFASISIGTYAGGGLWKRQEDLYDGREAERVGAEWFAAVESNGGRHDKS